jgi:outer membrane protein assembly factor BamE
VEIKMNIRNKFSFLLSAIILSSCSVVQVYQPDVQQGNIVNPELIAQIKQGMTRSTVQNILGNPVLDQDNISQMNYVYTFKHGKSPLVVKQVTIFMKNDKVYKVENIG